MAITYTPFGRSGTNILPPNQYMAIGQQLVSPNGRFRLVLQADSTLALFDGESVIWTADASQPYSMDIPNQNWVETRFFVSNSLSCKIRCVQDFGPPLLDAVKKVFGIGRT
ncbi:hypothetical protein [Pseudomonas congelans]|uniref:hypothetical protein n=1 Tax=Pseudomonas congelans TaxID=200452 RepID=UPI0013046821|nr:hypothetical protein [Pseudomonas congelans]